MNITSSYFAAMRVIVLRPSLFAKIYKNGDAIPAWLYFVSGCGMLFAVWFASAFLRQGSYPAWLLNVFTLLMILLSANVFALAVKVTGRGSPPFITVRDSYLYAFGTYSIWGLVLIEACDLAFVRQAIGRPTQGCEARNMECLLQATASVHLADVATKSIQFVTGSLALIFLAIFFSKATDAHLWRVLVGALAVTAFNFVMNESILVQLVDALKSAGLWG